MLEVFHTLAEVSVAVTGFSSLIIIFRGSSVDWSGQDYVRFGFILSWSIGSIFLSLLPILLVEFGTSLANASRTGLFCWVVFVVVAAGVLTRVQYRVARAGGERPGGRARTVMAVLTAGMTILCLAAGFDLLAGPVHAWYASSVTFLLVLATANLGEFVVHSTRGVANG